MTTSLNRFPEGARSPDSVCATTVDKTGTSGIPSSGVIHVTNLRIDTNKRQVYKGDERIRLTGMNLVSGAVSQPLWRKRFPALRFCRKYGDTHQSAT